MMEQTFWGNHFADSLLSKQRNNSILATGFFSLEKAVIGSTELASIQLNLEVSF
jgi:hypothetical protein